MWSQEKDDEVYGSGNSYDFGARIYDSRLGRFTSLDPFRNKFPNRSAYTFSALNPIRYIDVNGEFSIDPEVRKKYPKAATFIDEMFASMINNQRAMNKFNEVTHMPISRIKELFLANSIDELDKSYFKYGISIEEAWASIADARRDGIKVESYNNDDKYSTNIAQVPAKPRSAENYRMLVNNKILKNLEESLEVESRSSWNTMFLFDASHAATKMYTMEVLAHENVHFLQNITGYRPVKDIPISKYWDNGAEWELKMFGHSVAYQGFGRPPYKKGVTGIGLRGLKVRLLSMPVNSPTLKGFTYSEKDASSIDFFNKKFYKFLTNENWTTGASVKYQEFSKPSSNDEK